MQLNHRSALTLATISLMTLCALPCATAHGQTQSAPHAITGLPLPPDETAPAPAPVPAASPAPAPPAATTTPAAKTAPSRRASKPAKSAKPDLVVVAPETPAPAAPGTKAITGLPLPPDETPAPAPAPAAPAVKVEPPPPAPTPAPAPPPAKITKTKPAPPEPKLKVRTPATPPPAAATPAPEITPATVAPAATPAAPAAKPGPPPATVRIAPTVSAPVASPATAPKAVAVPKVTPTVVAPVAPSRPAPAAAPQPVAEVSAPAAYPAGTLADIAFQDPAPLTAADLRPLTGLAFGSVPSTEALNQAAQRLIDTGFYANVSASFDNLNGVGTATFALQPAAPGQLLRVSIANLIWLTQTEVDAALQPIPLFHGVIPAGGNLKLAAAVQAALERALAAKGVTATLTHAEVAASVQHPYPAIEFRATQPNVVLASALVYDVPQALVPATLKASDDATKIPYNEGSAGVTLSDLLLAPARDAGYIAAKLYRVERKRRVTAGAVYVDFTARMEPGPVFLVRALRWTPTPVLSAEEFRRIAVLRPGGKPTNAALLATQNAVVDAYRAHGYLTAGIDTQVALDSKAGGVDYTFTVDPGLLYTLRTLTVTGLSPAAQKDFDAAWTMKSGDPYNEPYLLNFLNNHPEIVSLRGYSFQFNRTATQDTHQIDLTLTFKPAH